MKASVNRLHGHLTANPARVIAKLFVPGEEASDSQSRVHLVAERVRAMTDDDVSAGLDAVQTSFSHRHRDFDAILERHYELVSDRLSGAAPLSQERRLLLGAYLTHEYSVEGAALCNPSMVRHPDQTGLPAGHTRFVMSVRAIGEGHLSSVEFRTGTAWHGGMAIDDPGTFLTMGTPVGRNSGKEIKGAARLRDVAASQYDLTFPTGTPIGEQLIWPSSATESHGIEDVRLVRFVHDDGTAVYHGTYTAYDGDHVTPYLLTTEDFHTYRMNAQSGPAARNKGMAWFPRRIGGSYVALSRWDRENISLATSADGQLWERGPIVRATVDAWEFIQVGNCGSPIETEAGWLVLTHGVGPMRTYGIGAILLDLDQPDRVLAETPLPLLEPDAGERDGYVPNVVYTCGAMLHDGMLTIPYGVNDASIRFAQTELATVLDQMR